MTTFTLMNLFTHKLLMVSKKDDSNIVIMADTRVIAGIPNGEECIKELVRSLLNYNEIDVNTKNITVFGMRNFDE